MFQPPTRYLGSDSEIILSRIEEKEIDPTLLNAALKDINDRADGEGAVFWGEKLPEDVKSVGSLIEQIKGKLVGAFATSMPDANEDTLPIQLPLRNITLDDNVMTLQFEQDEQFGGCFYIYDIKPDGKIEFQAKKTYPGIRY